jgi:hypothetical protein
VGNPPHNYWDEFGDNGFGAWDGLLSRFDVERNRCNNVGVQSPIDVRVNDAGKCYETHQIRTQVSTVLLRSASLVAANMHQSAYALLVSWSDLSFFSIH